MYRFYWILLSLDIILYHCYYDSKKEFIINFSYILRKNIFFDNSFFLYGYIKYI